LYTVAKNKALNSLNRDKYDTDYKKNQITESIEIVTELLTDKDFKDDLLQMMFACCLPSINADSQSVLILKTLCGFSIEEISKAYITNKETINKRLVRARKILKENEIQLILPAESELKKRLDAVPHTLYLLFNEAIRPPVATNSFGTSCVLSQYD